MRVGIRVRAKSLGSGIRAKDLEFKQPARLRFEEEQR
jgi:hypothetical protein